MENEEDLVLNIMDFEAKPKPKKKRKGFAKWEDDSRFEGSLGSYDLSKKGSLEAAGFPLRVSGNIVYYDPSENHTLLVGSTGSKKTRFCIMPEIHLLAEAGESMVVADPKGELLKETYGHLRDKGYNIRIINLRDMGKSDYYNPLLIPYRLSRSDNEASRDLAMEMIADLAMNICPIEDKNDPYWESSGQMLIQGLCMLLFQNCDDENLINFRSLCVLKNEMMIKTRGFDRCFDKLKRDSPAALCLTGIYNNADNTKKCIFSIFDRVMGTFASHDAMARVTSRNNIDMIDIGDKKTAVFIVVPDEKTTYHCIVSLFVKQCYESLIHNAQENNDMKLPVRVNFLLDEFASFPAINNFVNMISAARSRNIRFTLVVQCDKQLEEMYGRNNASIIWGNCNNIVFLSSSEYELLEKMSKLSGIKKNGHPLASVLMLQMLDKEHGEAFVRHDRLYPYITNYADISDYGYERSEVKYPESKSFVVKTFTMSKRPEDDFPAEDFGF